MPGTRSGDDSGRPPRRRLCPRRGGGTATAVAQHPAATRASCRSGTLVRMIRPVLIPTCALALTAWGCNSTRTDTFDVDIRNATEQPVTLSLAKDGPPYEPTWATPEDLAIESPKLREEWAGGPSGMGVVPPG